MPKTRSQSKKEKRRRSSDEPRETAGDGRRGSKSKRPRTNAESQPLTSSPPENESSSNAQETIAPQISELRVINNYPPTGIFALQPQPSRCSDLNCSQCYPASSSQDASHLQNSPQSAEKLGISVQDSATSSAGCSAPPSSNTIVRVLSDAIRPIVEYYLRTGQIPAPRPYGLPRDPAGNQELQLSAKDRDIAAAPPLTPTSTTASHYGGSVQLVGPHRTPPVTSATARIQPVDPLPNTTSPSSARLGTLVNRIESANSTLTNGHITNGVVPASSLLTRRLARADQAIANELASVNRPLTNDPERQRSLQQRTPILESLFDIRQLPAGPLPGSWETPPRLDPISNGLELRHWTVCPNDHCDALLPFDPSYIRQHLLICTSGRSFSPRWRPHPRTPPTPSSYLHDGVYTLENPPPNDESDWNTEDTSEDEGPERHFGPYAVRTPESTDQGPQLRNGYHSPRSENGTFNEVESSIGYEEASFLPSGQPVHYHPPTLSHPHIHPPVYTSPYPQPAPILSPTLSEVFRQVSPCVNCYND